MVLDYPEVEEDLTKDTVTTGATCCAMVGRVHSMESRNLALWKLEKVRNGFFSRVSGLRGRGPADIMIQATETDLQNCKSINLCFKPPSSQQFVNSRIGGE